MSLLHLVSDDAGAWRNLPVLVPWDVPVIELELGDVSGGVDACHFHGSTPVDLGQRLCQGEGARRELCRFVEQLDAASFLWLLLRLLLGRLLLRSGL